VRRAAIDGIVTRLQLRGVRLLAAGVSSPVGVGKPRSIESAGAFGVSERREFYGSGGIVLNTPDGVTAPAP
jgi:hypothetical protein